MKPTNSKILQEAEKIFAQKGFLKTSIQEIARACNLGVGTLYHHFPNKEEILFAILERNLKKHFEESNNHISGVTNPISQLEKYIWFQFFFVQKYPNYAKLVLLEFRHHAGLKETPAYQHLKGIVNQLIPILQEGQKQGLFDHDMDTLTFRNMIWGTLEAFTRNWLVFKRPESITDFAPVVTKRILKAIGSPLR